MIKTNRTNTSKGQGNGEGKHFQSVGAAALISIPASRQVTTTGESENE
jgi:hypothetical protein